MKLTHNKLIHS